MIDECGARVGPFKCNRPKRHDDDYHEDFSKRTNDGVKWRTGFLGTRKSSLTTMVE
jgi:hypothetical protein